MYHLSIHVCFRLHNLRFRSTGKHSLRSDCQLFSLHNRDLSASAALKANFLVARDGKCWHRGRIPSKKQNQSCWLHQLYIVQHGSATVLNCTYPEWCCLCVVCFHVSLFIVHSSVRAIIIENMFFFSPGTTLVVRLKLSPAVHSACWLTWHFCKLSHAVVHVGPL